MGDTPIAGCAILGENRDLKNSKMDDDWSTPPWKMETIQYHEIPIVQILTESGRTRKSPSHELQPEFTFFSTPKVTTADCQVFFVLIVLQLYTAFEINAFNIWHHAVLICLGGA